MSKEKQYFIHPSKIIMYLLLCGITALFAAFSLSYLFTRFDAGIPPVKLPSLFYYNTILLLASSYTLIVAQKSYEQDHTERFKWSLLLTLLLSIVFLIAQILAWNQFQSQGIFVNYSNMSAYMYLISGVHLAHLLIGIPFLIKFILDAFRYMKSPVTVLVYFSDPSKKQQLDLFNIYWHYLDVLWIYLVVFFAVNYFVA